MITGGFGMEIDLKSGTTRRWALGRDGVKRWVDTGHPCESAADFVERYSDGGPLCGDCRHSVRSYGGHTCCVDDPSKCPALPEDLVTPN